MIASKEEKIKSIERSIHKNYPEFEKYIEDSIDDMLLHNTGNKTFSAFLLADKFKLSTKIILTLMNQMCNVLKYKGYNAEVIKEESDVVDVLGNMYIEDHYLIIKK
jgi:hypothetical protein